MFEPINILMTLFMLSGVLASSVSGALRAIDSKMDITGAILLSFIISNSGGTIRDLILRTDVFWIVNNLYLWIAILTSIVIFILCSIYQKLITSKTLKLLLLISDAFGLGAFCVAGVEKSLILGNNITIAVVMGIWTAVGGGILADIVSNRIPLIFRGELYITVALFGAVVYLFLCQFIAHSIAGILSIILMVLLRLLSLHFKLRLPIL